MSILSSISATPPLSPSLANATPLTATNSASSGVSFGDVVDALNPLQHIPVLSGLYRAATGSSISAGSQIVGDTLYGGVLGVGSAIVGLATSTGNVLLQQATGSNVSQYAVSALGIGSSGASPTNPATALANATPLVANNAALITASNTTTSAALPTPSPLVNALNAIYHNAQSARGTTMYQSAKALDNINASLVKMAV